jgi:dihydroorotase
MSILNHESIDIIGARLVDPQAGIDKISNLYVRRGKLYHQKPSGEPGKKVISGKELVVVPGFLDLRTHCRVPGDSKAESIASLTEAAAKGGFTSILTMPDTNPLCDNPATVRYIQDRVNQASKIQVYISGSLTIQSKGESMSPLGSLKDVGVVAVTDCPLTPQNNQIFLNALKYADMFGLVIIDFPQDSYLSKNTHAHESFLSMKMGLSGSPSLAEELAVQRSILISKHLDIPIHLSSISSKGSVKLIKNAKASGIKISADVSAFHLLLNHKKIEDYQTNAKFTPPLREEADRLELIDGVLEGIIDSCNSSHQPYAEHHKNVEFDLAPPGAIGLETAALSFIDSLKDKNPFKLLAEKMSYNPHKILRLKPPSLKKGSTANFTVFKLNEPWSFTKGNSVSQSFNTPLENYKFKHKIILTYSENGVAFSNSL